MNSPSTIWRDLLGLTLFFTLLFTAFLGSRPLMTPDEGRYAEIPREMVESGDYLTPRLNYMKYFEKPPFFYWMEAASIKVFGLNNWSLRLMVAISAWFGCCMVYLGGLRLFSRRTGILAFLILSTSLLYFVIGRTIITDMPFAVWINACLMLFLLGTQERVPSKKSYYFWGMYISAALAVLTKGLAGIVLPGLVIFLWMAATNSWRELKTYCLPSGTFLFLIVAAPWHIQMQIHYPEFFHFYFIEQHFLRYFTSYAKRDQGLWFIPAVTLVGFFPWIIFGGVFAFKKLKSFFQRKPAHPIPSIEKTSTLFLIIWASVIFIFFTFSQSQLIPYAVPILPPLTLLTANCLSKEWHKTASSSMNLGFSLFMLLGIGISIGVSVYWYLNFLDESGAWVLPAGGLALFCTSMGSLIVYRRYGVRLGIIALILGMSIFLVLGDMIYGKVAERSMKPLAMVILKQQVESKKDIPVACYGDYYQDLPVYLKKRVWVINYYGELAFGIQYQDTRAWVMDDATFWSRWRQPAKLFMITSLKQYEILQKKGIENIYPISKTDQYILLSNQP